MKEKCVSAFESNRIIPRPSSRSGGSTIGKTAAHNSFKVLDSRGLPTSANFAISARCCFSASERLPARQRARLIDQADAFAVESVDSRQKPKSAQRSVRACRKIEACGIGTVDDIEVMITRVKSKYVRQAADKPPGRRTIRTTPRNGLHRSDRRSRGRHRENYSHGCHPTSLSSSFRRTFPRGPSRPLSIRKP